MQLWIAAMFIGFLAVGLGSKPSYRHAHRLILLVILVVIGYEALKLHAI